MNVALERAVVASIDWPPVVVSQPIDWPPVAVCPVPRSGEKINQNHAGYWLEDGWKW